MSADTEGEHAGARFDAARFLEAQSRSYAQALGELRAGRKRSHWMWYVFPQLAGLGASETSRYFALGGAAQAEAYLGHPVLGARLRECAEAVLGITGRSASEIFGYPDDLKLHSSATLFAAVSPDGSVFHRVLERFFGGQRDARTVALLARATPSR